MTKTLTYTGSCGLRAQDPAGGGHPEVLHWLPNLLRQVWALRRCLSPNPHLPLMCSIAARLGTPILRLATPAEFHLAGSPGWLTLICRAARKRPSFQAKLASPTRPAQSCTYGGQDVPTLQLLVPAELRWHTLDPEPLTLHSHTLTCRIAPHVTMTLVALEAIKAYEKKIGL
jgi:hypothetical protein